MNWDDGTPLFTTCRRCRRDVWDILIEGCVYGCWDEDGTHYTHIKRYDVPGLPAGVDA